jgi:hypothetical protein
MKTMLLVLMALFASCAIINAQGAGQNGSGSTKAGDQHEQAAGKKTAAKSGQTPELQEAITTGPSAQARPSLIKDAGPTGVEDAARKAAHDLAAASQDKSQAKAGSPAKDAQAAAKDEPAAAPSGIGEFHEMPAGTSRSSANPVVQKESSPGSRIHGDLYGAGGPAGRAGSESVGATSKSGKTSVYVQSDQTSSTVPPQ